MSATLSRRRRLLFSGIVALFVGLCVEAIAQAFYYATAGVFRFESTSIYAADATRCYKVRPNLAYASGNGEFRAMLYTNAQGFRTDERREPFPVEKPRDVYRILALGPSFAFGWGAEYEDTYAVRIANALQIPGKRVELLNLGTPAQGPAPQLCWLAEEGHRFAPDLVLLTTYGASLLRLPAGCPERVCRAVVEDGRLYLTPQTLKTRLLRGFKSSAVVFYGYYVYTALLPGADASPPAGDGKELRDPDEQFAAPDPGELVARTRAYVRAVRDIVGEATEVAMLHLPYSYMVHTGDWRRWRIAPDAHIEAHARLAADVAAARAADLPILDATPALLAARDQTGNDAERLYYWFDVHLTPAGNRVVADFAARALQQRIAPH